MSFSEIRKFLIKMQSDEDLKKQVTSSSTADDVALIGQRVGYDFSGDDLLRFNGQKVDISGKSMGRGFAGYQKSHGFSRGPMSLGSKNHRAPGSTGAGTTPGRIYPGKRMAGRYGGKQITTKGLLVLKIDDQKNLLVVKGSVPGKPGSIVNIKPNNIVGEKGGKKS